MKEPLISSDSGLWVLVVVGFVWALGAACFAAGVVYARRVGGQQ